jgi:hypothetical protein
MPPQEVVMEKPHSQWNIPDRRIDAVIGQAVREGKSAAGLGDYAETLSMLSRRGVPRAVIERIFVYRQCCRATDGPPSSHG